MSNQKPVLIKPKKGRAKTWRMRTEGPLAESKRRISPLGDGYRSGTNSRAASTILANECTAKKQKMLRVQKYLYKINIQNRGSQGRNKKRGRVQGSVSSDKMVEHRNEKKESISIIDLIKDMQRANAKKHLEMLCAHLEHRYGHTHAPHESGKG
jgi:hypothetical protein